MDVIEHLLRQFRAQLGPAVPIDDLRSAGHEGLAHAVRGFDASRGVPFRRWANLRVKGAMIDAMRAGGNLPRRVYRQLRAMEAAGSVVEGRLEDEAAQPPAGPAAADAKITERLDSMATAMAMAFLSMRAGEEAYAVADERKSADEILHEETLKVRVKAAIGNLDTQERTLLEQHYFHDRTLEEAGKSLGLSKSWASRLHARAIDSLAKTLKRELR
jgi:RNA polymerase sigma factor for flagellar operon FliA